MTEHAARLTAYALLAVVVASNVLGNMFIKLASQSFSKHVFLWGFLSWQLAAGIACFACGVLVYATALRSVPLYAAQSIVALQFIGIVFMASIYFKEQITHLQWAGITFMVLGLALVLRQAP